jgi:hypothetical protein
MLSLLYKVSTGRKEVASGAQPRQSGDDLFNRYFRECHSSLVWVLFAVRKIAKNGQSPTERSPLLWLRRAEQYYPMCTNSAGKMTHTGIVPKVEIYPTQQCRSLPYRECELNFSDPAPSLRFPLFCRS